jgi:polyhydroxyalkanoate synthesis regulator phasin
VLTDNPIKEFYEAYLNGQATAEEFYQNILNYIKMDSEISNAILSQLVNIGQTQDQARAYLEKLLQEVQNGNKTAADAFNELMTMLNGISTQLQGMTDLLKLLDEQGELSNQKADQTNAKIQEFYEAYLSGKATAEEFYKNVVNYMAGDYEMKKLMLEKLTQNGLSQEQANAYLQKLLQEVQTGKISAADAYNEIINILNGIAAQLQGMTNILDVLAEQGKLSNQKLIKLMLQLKNSTKLT